MIRTICFWNIFRFLCGSFPSYHRGKPRTLPGKNIALLRYSFTVPVQHLPCACSWFSLPLFLFSFCLFYFLKQDLTECPRLALRSLCSPGKTWTWSPCASAFLVAGIVGMPHLPWLGRPIRQVPFMSLPRNVALNESSDFFRREICFCVYVFATANHMGVESQTQVVWLGGEYLHPLSHLPASDFFHP